MIVGALGFIGPGQGTAGVPARAPVWACPGACAEQAGWQAMRIDLHAHTEYSDGTDTAEELLATAVAAGLDVIALTDHDTTGGWDAVARARPSGLAVIRGAEFSTQVLVGGRSVSVHLLGYLFDPDDPAIAEEQARLKGERRRRGLTIVERMAGNGVPITADQVLAIAGDAPIGRPHIGRALVAAGLVRTVDEAFVSYLAGRSPYYVAKADTDLLTAISMISAAGGASVIAHPRGRGEARALDFERIAVLAEAGLTGLEVDHPDHDDAQRAELRSICDRLGLVPTGSSDYHGHNKVLRLGQETTSPASLARIVAATSGVVPPLGAVG